MKCPKCGNILFNQKDFDELEFERSSMLEYINQITGNTKMPKKIINKKLYVNERFCSSEDYTDGEMTLCHIDSHYGNKNRFKAKRIQSFDSHMESMPLEQLKEWHEGKEEFIEKLTNLDIEKVIIDRSFYIEESDYEPEGKIIEMTKKEYIAYIEKFPKEKSPYH